MSTTATSGRSRATASSSASAVADRREDLEAVVAQEPLQAVAQQRQILGDHNAHRRRPGLARRRVVHVYPHGICARTVVGPPLGLITTSVPSSACTRRRNPSSPPPAGSAPPTPSS